MPEVGAESLSSPQVLKERGLPMKVKQNRDAEQAWENTRKWPKSPGPPPPKTQRMLGASGFITAQVTTAVWGANQQIGRFLSLFKSAFEIQDNLF